MTGSSVRPSDPNNAYVTAYDKAIAANPPVIEWRKNRRGVMVAVRILDPHAESVGHVELMDRIDRREAEEERRLLEMQEQARMVALRFEKHRADNTPLMQAARSAI